MQKRIFMIRELEADCVGMLNTALEHGLTSEAGKIAFRSAMLQLRTATELKSEMIYAPLLEDPNTCDYVRRLEGQLFDLSERIGTLRRHLEQCLDSGTSDTDQLTASAQRLRRRLLVLFKKESALRPIYATWCDRTIGRFEQSLPGTAEPSMAIYH